MSELKDGKCKCTVCGQQFPLQIDGQCTFEEQEEEHAET